FALEVPFQEGFAGRYLMPAGIASAVSYLVFVAIAGTEPLFAVSGAPPFSWSDLLGAACGGVVVGIGAPLFVVGLPRAATVRAHLNPFVRAAVAGLLLAVYALVSNHLFDRPLSLGPGYNSITWALNPDRTVALVVALLALRTLATLTTVGG